MTTKRRATKGKGASPPRRKRTGGVARRSTGSPVLDELLGVSKTAGACREEVAGLVSLLSQATAAEDLDPMRLAPPGTLLADMADHFLETDISFALPVVATFMHAAGFLTQNRVELSLPGVGSIKPTAWVMNLADSGSAKTLAFTRVHGILERGGPPLRMLPTGATDAKWIEDLADNNHCYWVQDEAGKFFESVLKIPNRARMKPWLLDAYSHQAIHNRTKAGIVTVAEPAFAFNGPSVLSTFSEDVSRVNFLDGFCQRFNYFVAPRRADRDMFDHFLYFQGADVMDRETRLAETWARLCAQPAATEIYTISDEALAFLSTWWNGQREAWGGAVLPASFVRRIGFSVLRYATILQFLLGKARHPIDVETASIAARYAEYNFKSLQIVLSRCDPAGVDLTQKVREIRSRLERDGKPVDPRSVARCATTRDRKRGLDTALVRAIDAIGEMGGRFKPRLLEAIADERDLRSAAAHAARREERRNRDRLARLPAVAQPVVEPRGSTEVELFEDERIVDFAKRRG